MNPSASHPLDDQLAALLQRLDGEAADSEALQQLVKYVSACTREGVIAAPLSGFDRDALALLKGSAVVGREGDYKPLVVSDTHAWLYRYWQYEQRLADCIRKKIPPAPPFEKGGLGGISDLQQHAIELALRQNFLIISGGPGTGKTTTVTRILAHLLEQGVEPSRILLAAPTGKAAMRMQEAIRATRQRLALPAEVAERIPEQASTLHRLLGYIPNRVGFRHNRDNPLLADVVIVDEASMIDISLMTQLFEAVPDHARLLLLGDKDQLASVETGSIFRDLCMSPALAQHIVVLQKSYRFAAEDGVGQLALAIREAHETRMLEVLASPGYPDVTLDDSQGGLDADIVRRGWQAYVDSVSRGELRAIFAAFDALRILTPLRKGRQGVEALNRWVDAVMQRRLPVRRDIGFPWYIGRPVMVTQNDYRQNLFNGDIGIALPNAAGELRVWFPDAEPGEYRAIAPVRLPVHETAWAMTIHKSQGSEFERVLLILPDTEDLPLLGRELLYTAVTRARQGIHVIAGQQVLRHALRHVTPLSSQLPRRLL